MTSDPLYDELRYPGSGLPEREISRNRPLSPWGRGMVDQTYGKKTNIRYDATKALWQFAEDSICEPRLLDIDATQMQVTLISPAAIPRDGDDIGPDVQNATGEFNNANVTPAGYPGSNIPIAWPPFTAYLKWGTGGARAEAFIDWVNGTTINITASALDLRAAVAPDAANAASPGTSGLYTLAAFVSPGWPRPGNAQRTIYVGALDESDESDIFQVPLFAKRVTVIGATVGGAAVVTAAFLRFWQSPDGTNPVGDYFVNGNQPLPFNVPNGGMYFSIVNAGAAANFSICSELAI